MSSNSNGSPPTTSRKRREVPTSLYLGGEYGSHDDFYSSPVSSSSDLSAQLLHGRDYPSSALPLRDEYAKDMIRAKHPRFYSARERRKMERYESLDTHEPETTVYKDHLESRQQEPRWFIWVFVFCLGVAASMISILVVSVLHMLNGVRYELLGFGLRGFNFYDSNRYPHPEGNASNTTESGNLDVSTMFQGAGVGLYGIEPRSYSKGYLMYVTFSLFFSILSSMICAIVPESVGSGLPEVMAYLNGVRYPMLDSLRVLLAKVSAVICSVASGVCTGHYGTLIVTGAMLGEQALCRRRHLRCYSVNIVECFRNPRDHRIIVVIGAAAGVASAFSVAIGGLMVVVELISTILPVHFALYVFTASLVSSLTLQIYFSFFSYFDFRNRDANAKGELITGMDQSFKSHIPFDKVVQMNISYFIPAILIGLICGALSGVFIRLSWLALVLRRRLERRLRTKVVRFILPVLFTVVYVTANYWLAVSFGSEGWSSENSTPSTRRTPTITPTPSLNMTDDVLSEISSMESFQSDGVVSKNSQSSPCVGVPDTILTTRNVSVIAFYGANGFFCAAPYTTSSSSTLLNDVYKRSEFNGNVSYTDAQPRRAYGERPQTLKVLHSYASLAFANADSALQMLLTWRTEDMLSANVLCVFLVFYFIFSALFLGVSLCGDTLLPGLVVGATVGRLTGVGIFYLAAKVSTTASSWADPGCFALIGAGSFIGGTTGLTFSICTILLETTGDFRHVLPLMMGITVAKKTAELLTHNINSIFLEARSVPLLDFENQVHKYPMFDARHVMISPVVTLETVCTMGRIHDVLCNTRHNGFPIVSVRDGTYKGIISRQQLQILLWHAHFTHSPSLCTYELAKKVEERLFHESLLGTIPPLESREHLRLDLSPYIDQSGFCVLGTTTLPRTYIMFRTLGLRHLVVVRDDNHIIGLITRKDLVSDRLIELVSKTNENRRLLLESRRGSDHNASDGVFPSHFTPSLPARAMGASPAAMDAFRVLGAALHSTPYRTGEWIVMAREDDERDDPLVLSPMLGGGMHPTPARGREREETNASVPSRRPSARLLGLPRRATRRASWTGVEAATAASSVSSVEFLTRRNHGPTEWGNRAASHNDLMGNHARSSSSSGTPEARTP